MLLAGCAAQQPALRVCPGKATAAEALQTLAARAQSAIPVRASGRAAITYHVPDRRKPEQHAMGMQLRLNPPSEVYLQGGIAVDERAVVMGSNQEQFWLALRPREISSYYLGEWQEVRDFEGLMMSPMVVLEAVGIVVEPETMEDAASWTLRQEGAYDVLTRRDERGRPVKRLHIYACDYTIRKIEYFDPRGRVAAVAQLGGYQAVAEGFQTPTRIDIVSTRPDQRTDSIRIEIGTVRPTPFTDKQREGLFQPPRDLNRYERIYHLKEGQWVLQ
ncbi:MAG: outer membrane lipoprotein-sorting protein [Planctomycetes bacterium]|nr:outer membrane lipoprotein-sorting protein [Planctomycetota bacterium]